MSTQKLNESGDDKLISKSQELNQPLAISTMLGVAGQPQFNSTLSTLVEERSSTSSASPNSSYYCLMIKEYSSSDCNNNDLSSITTSNNNSNNNNNQSFTLNIVHTNASNIQTHNIKSFILSKLLKNMIYKTGSIGRIEDTSLNSSNMNIDNNIGSNSSNNDNIVISCFYTLIEVQEPNNINTTTSSSTAPSSSTISSSPSTINSDLTSTTPPLQTDFENLDFSININDSQTLLSDIENCGNTIKEYYLCLCYEHPESQLNNIESFHLELDDFCHDIGYLIKSSDQDILISTLSNWYSNSINYLTRTIDLFNEKISYLLHSSLTGYGFEVETSNKLIAKDIIHFLRSISILNLVVTNISNNEEENIYQLKPESVNSSDTLVKISLSKDNILKIDYKGTNGFCRKWCKIFFEYRSDSLKLRNLTEEFKLKVIQELNLFRRMVDSSKNNNYLLYKTYLFLVGSDNSDILLDLLKKDNDDPIIKDILSILQLQLQQ